MRSCAHTSQGPLVALARACRAQGPVPMVVERLPAEALPSQPAYITVVAAARLSGLSVKALRRLIAEGRLPVLAVAGCVRVNRVELLGHLSALESRRGG